MGTSANKFVGRDDCKILDIIQRDASMTTEQIAEKIDISASSVQRRIRKMRDTGVIQRQVALVDAKKLGYPLTFVAALEIERERKELLIQLKRWLDREDTVQQVFYVTGAADIFLIIIASDVEDYDIVTQRLLEENPNVRRLTTSVVLQTYKRDLFVPPPQE